MKIKMFFVAIAIVALLSAFMTRTSQMLHYRYVGEHSSGNYWQVDPTPRTEGTGSGEFQCSVSFGQCVVNAVDTEATPQSGSFIDICSPSHSQPVASAVASLKDWYLIHLTELKGNSNIFMNA